MRRDSLLAGQPAPDRGQALVEFALILPILLILLLGLIDVGRAVGAYNSVSNAARSGARVAIVDQNADVVTAAVEAEAVGLAEVDVQSNFNAESDAQCPRIGCLVEVTVSTLYTPATPFISSLVGEITVSSASLMPMERVYVSP